MEFWKEKKKKKQNTAGTSANTVMTNQLKRGKQGPKDREKNKLFICHNKIAYLNGGWGLKGEQEKARLAKHAPEKAQEPETLAKRIRN